MSDATLVLEQVTRIYEQGDRRLTVLHNFDLDIRKGEVVALVGPSGSGKTTLLQVAGLLDTPDSGEVRIASRIMTGASDIERTLARRRHIGFVYQFHHLLPEFSALENVMLPQMIAGVDTAKAKTKAQGLLAELGLSERESHRPARLSGGEQQRVAIARALANDPQLLLADEPTGNLDPLTAELVFGMLMRLVREKQVAMLVATHNLELAKRMDRIVSLGSKMEA
jgi:lipoprotein-releasing system ATP-binding protein